ncbi:MAG TPA: hypothetical protein VHT28_08625 [Silvibacterium sp.]|jgi:hypothetical protein|nr:hypothetical protein [Silvibacterium sp.]
MARNASRIKLGYYPLPSVEGARLRRLLDFAPGASAVDPCAGTGAALHQIGRRRSGRIARRRTQRSPRGCLGGLRHPNDPRHVFDKESFVKDGWQSIREF